ncbi:MAG TPA: dihydrolipoyl dehydrogenase [Bacteroidetes bacterium]|nr:dihydrolipoyl dehydrogenase [Bacteroidota bacterium]
MENTYDLIVIGAGPGGYSAAVRGAQLGLRTAIVERENLGGICLNWGCIPTKALLKSAEVYTYLNHAADYALAGVSVPAPDLPAIVQRSRDIAAQMSRGVEFLMKKNKIDVFSATARVLPGHRVEIVPTDGEASRELSAPHILIATGARSRQLPGLPQDGERIIGYRQALTLQQLPETMLVVGSGAIGSELAYFYNALGTKVTVVEYLPRILPLEDAEVSREAERIFRKRGIKSMTGTQVLEARPTAEGTVQVTVQNAKGTQELSADVVLSAAGIQANIEDLGLEQVGIEVSRGKIVVDRFYRTSVPGYYAIGDVVPGPALAHVAAAEAVVAAEAIGGLTPEPVDYGNIPGATYITPQVASVGLTEEKALQEGYTLRVGKFPFTASGKARAAGRAEGFVKVIFDQKTDRLLGAHIIGENATEMIAEAVVARKGGLTAMQLLRAVHPHPTMSEGFYEAVAAAYGEAINL